MKHVIDGKFSMHQKNYALKNQKTWFKTPALSPTGCDIH